MHSTEKAIVNKLMKNSAALMAIQLSNYALPFILIPYLTRVLGVELYGIYGFVLAIYAFSYVITDFGFGLSAVPALVNSAGDSLRKNEIISSIFVVKGALCVLVGLFLHIFLMVNDKYLSYDILIYASLLSVVGQAYQPVWYFQAIESMAYITLYTFISRIFYVVLVLFWVVSASDLMLLIVLNGLSQLMAAVIAVIIMIGKGYSFVIPSWVRLKDVVNLTGSYFISRLAVSLYTSFPALYFGMVSSSHQMAFYTAAEQIYKGCQSLFSPVAEALYPSMLKSRNLKLFGKILVIGVWISVFGVFVGFYLSEEVVKILFGSDYSQAVPVLDVFIIALAFNIPSVLLGYPLLGAMGFARFVNTSVVIAGLIQFMILIMLYFLDLISPISVSISIVLVECLVFILRGFWARKFIYVETA